MVVLLKGTLCRNVKLFNFINHQKRFGLGYATSLSFGLGYATRLSRFSSTKREGVTQRSEQLKRMSGPPSAIILGLGGLIPFVGCTIGATIVMPEALYLLSETQSFYGASILSFLGGIQWGSSFHTKVNSVSVDKDFMSVRLVASVIPSLAGFFSLLLPDLSIRLLVQTVSFLFTLGWDVLTASKGWYPQWMLPLRYLLTTIVSLSLGMNSYLCWVDKSK